MNFIHTCILFVVILFLSACNPEKAVTIDHPTNDLFTKLEREQLRQNQMLLVAAGVPCEEDIDVFTMHFVAFKQLKLPEVRKLVVNSVECFLEKANKDEKLIPLMKKHPITYREITFNVGFGNSDGEFQEPPYIAYAYLDEGIVYYCYEDRDFGNFVEEENVEEPYETAKMIVQNSKNDEDVPE